MIADPVVLSPKEPVQNTIRVLTIADILTDTVRRIFSDESVSEVFRGENQLF